MSHDIDVLMADFRNRVPVPPLIPASEVAHRTVNRQAVRTTRRPFAVAIGSVATAALVVAMTVLLVSGPGTREAITLSTPRADWGVVATVKVVPDRDESLEAAVERAKAWLADRSKRRDLAGLVIEPLGDDLLRLTVPGTKGTNTVGPTDLQTLLTPPRFAVHDLGDVRASSDTIAGLAVDDGAGLFVLGPVGVHATRTRDEADALATKLGDVEPPLEVVPLPSNTHVVRESGIRGVPAGMLLVDDERSLLTPSDMEDVHVDGSRIVMTVRPGSRGRAITAIAKAQGSVTLIVEVPHPMGSPGALSEAVGTLSRDQSAADGSTVVFEGPGTTHVSLLGLDPNTGATTFLAGHDPAAINEYVFGERVTGPALSLEAVERYGQAPGLTGDAASLPPTLQSFPRGFKGRFGTASVGSPSSQPVRVLHAEMSVGRVDVFAARLSSGEDVFEAISPLGGVATYCDPGPGLPTIVSCGPMNGVWTGRVTTEVASIEQVSTDGTVTAGTVQNGWAALVLREPFGQSRIVARDAAGDAIATMDSYGRTIRIEPETP